MSAVINKACDVPEYAYHLLRGALENFQKNISELDAQQYQQAKAFADKTYALESIVLSTPEARDIQIPEQRLEAAVQEVTGRYADHASFAQDLEVNGLNEDILRRALYRELLFDAVMGRVTAKSPTVNDIDIQIFYQLHRQRFTRPEKRKVRHILVTINPEYPENTRDAAYARISAVAEKLKQNSSRFEALAKKHSECPTAVDGGRLGEVARGTLFPELDAELFSMHEGEISEVIETEMGFHILYCEKINKPVTAPLSRARERIKQILQERQRKACQKAWLEKVQGEAHG